MTDPSSPPSGPRADPDGVRTYRGRTIEELIPRIRAELGPDAIILREREGLMGGIGGFFAQKCVEIDAQAAPRVNVYADDFEDEDYDEELEGTPEKFEAFSQGSPQGYVPVPLPDAPPPDYDAPAVSEAPAVPPAPEPPVSEAPPVPPAPEPPVTEVPPIPAAPLFDEASFAARLEEATFTAEEVPPGPEPEPEPAPAPVAGARPAFIAFDELEEAPAPEPEPAAAEPELEPVGEEPEPEHPIHRALEPAPWLAFAAESAAVDDEATAEPEAEEPEPEPEAEEPAPEPGPVAAPPPPPPAPPPQYGTRRRGGLLPAAERMLRAALDATTAANERREREYETRLAANAPSARPFPGAPAAAAPGRNAEATREPEQQRRDADLEHRLIRAGLSPGRAAALVGAAISRRGPFSADGSVADDVRALIAASLPTPVHLPSDRGAVAVVGAGGSGKTRSVAALASAQAHAGTLVNVASLGAPGREDELGALLHGEAVNIIPAMRTRATARAVSSARERGLVLIDTAPAAPRDDSTIDVMAETLNGFGLNGIYLTVPATLSSAAAVKLVDSFSAFDLTGMIATHVDETDGLGQIAELSMQTGIPVAYTLTGTELQAAVQSADPEHIAAELLR